MKLALRFQRCRLGLWDSYILTSSSLTRRQKKESRIWNSAVEVFWLVTSYSVTVGYQRFGGPCCVFLQDSCTGCPITTS